MNRLLGHREHLVRVAGLFLAGIVCFVVLQALLTPEGFGRYGHYRAGALDDARARGLTYAGRAACVECHADAADAAKGGGHAAVHCEACHGPLAAHAADPSKPKAAKPDPEGAVRALPPGERGAARSRSRRRTPPSTRAASLHRPATSRTTPRMGGEEAKTP